MSLYLVLKYLHVIGAVVLLGTGSGIAFFMLAAHLSREAAFVVLADALFTATAAVAQPMTGYWLTREAGLAVSEPWVALSLALYVAAGAAWLPVVWIQVRMRDLARVAADAGRPLPEAYHRLFRVWLVLGFPGFALVAAILWLMIAKPALWS